MLGLRLSPVAQAVRGRRPWTPARLFAQGQQGVWYEPRPEYLYQDSAGTTPVTADGQPAGYMQDLSSNGKHSTQATAAKKPVYRLINGIYRLDIDDVDDQMVSQKVSVICSVLVLARRKNDNNSVLLNSPGSNGGYLFVSQSGSTAPLTDSSGSPATYIDGALVTTRDESSTITSDLQWHIMEAVGVNFAAWAEIGIGGYVDTAYRSIWEFGGMIIFAGTADDERDASRQYLANLAGVTL